MVESHPNYGNGCMEHSKVLNSHISHSNISHSSLKTSMGQSYTTPGLRYLEYLDSFRKRNLRAPNQGET